MPADPIKPVEGADNGSGLNPQPVTPPASDSKGKGQDDKGKPTSPDTSNLITKEKYEEDIKSRDGTISALQKKIDTLTNGLSSALGIEQGGNKSTEDLIASLQNQVDTLRNENVAAKTEKAVATILDNYQDDKGNTLTPQVKSYLMKKVNAASVDPKDLNTLVQAEIKEVLSVFGGGTSSVVTPKGKDTRPEAKGQNLGKDVNRPKNANQILDDVSD